MATIITLPSVANNVCQVCMLHSTDITTAQATYDSKTFYRGRFCSMECYCVFICQTKPASSHPACIPLNKQKKLAAPSEPA